MDDAQRHERVMELFDQACDLEGDTRGAYLERVCAGDRALRSEVEALLAHDEGDHDAVRAAEAGAGIRVLSESLGNARGESMPAQIGPYQVLGVIGKGGMGVVYEAQQKQPNRRIALKVIRTDLASEQLIRRFRREADVLAQMQHPCIAHVYESGVADGDGSQQPYFAMELIEGEPLDMYVKRHSLDPRRVLALFVQICEAVQHAHQKGVIHRDLKPGNILVKDSDSATNSQHGFDGTSIASEFDGLGTPKILDFGIARVTHSDLQATTLKTDMGQIVGTLSYMSPEQVTGSQDHIDTRSDIYALGVILYQLLTDRLPFDLNDEGIAHAARRICDEEPTRMSAIDRALRGDLDTIVSKALEKDPARRYQTAAELATDIRRFLNDQPILARPASTMYQLRKFTRRNKALVGGIVMTFIALTAGLITSGTLLVSVTRERDAKQVALEQKSAALLDREEALREKQVALEASDAVTAFLTNMIKRATPENKGKDVTVRELMDLSEQEIAKHFADKPLVQARIRSTIGSAYVGLAEYDLANKQFERAISLFQQEPQSNAEELFDTRLRHITVSMFRDDYETARDQLSQLLEDAQLEPNHGLNIGMLYTLRARAAMRIGSLADAAKDLELGVKSLIEQYGSESATVLNAKSNLAELYSRLGSDRTEPFYHELIAQSRKLRGEDHPETILLIGNLAGHFQRNAQCTDAIPMLRKVYESQLRQLGDSHRQTMITVCNLGRCLALMGHTQEAVDIIDAGLSNSIERNGERSATTLFLTLALGQVLRQTDDDEGAERTLQRAVDLHRQVSGPTAEGTWRSETELLRHFIKQRRATEAVDWAEEIYEAMKDSLPDNHARFTQIHYYLGQAYALADRVDDAERHLLEAKRMADQTWLPKVRQQLDELHN